jgi:hypothetical protein
MAQPAEVTQPIVVDLGKAKKKRIRQLKRGRGPLVLEVQDVVNEVSASLGEEGAGKQLVPIVVLYRRKQRKGYRGGLFPFF